MADLGGIAAILALASIPVNIQVARWQVRSGLTQAEAAYKSALEVAKAGHKAAMELAEAQHQAALALAQATHSQTMELEGARARRADILRALDVVREIQDAAGVLRLEYLRQTVSDIALSDAYGVLHDGPHHLGPAGTPELLRALSQVVAAGNRLLLTTTKPLAERTDYWNREMSPRRAELDEAAVAFYRANAW